MMRLLIAILVLTAPALGASQEIKAELLDNPRELPTKDLVQLLSKPESKGSKTTARLASIEAIIGPANKTAPSPRWKNSHLSTYFLSGDRRLELTSGSEGQIYLEVIIAKSGNTLVFK